MARCASRQIWPPMSQLGQYQTSSGEHLMSATSSIADMHQGDGYVSFVPILFQKSKMRVKDLAGKIAFVTGAASGIGLGIETAFAQAGAKVMLCDIEEAALSAALKQLRLTNVDVDGVKADVSLKAELVAAAEATI